MLNNFDYLWKRLLCVCVCVCVCVNSTFGRCCHCPCEKEETLYFTKIDKNAQGEEDIKKCFNKTWYNECQNKVLSLQQVNENGSDVLKVTGSGNKWTITDPQGKVLGSAGCKPEGNKWIIVKVTILNDDSDCAGGSFIFYVDDIKSVKDENSDHYGVFEEIKCYSIKIIAANTRGVEDMKCVFFQVHSALEEDGKKESGPGLIGLDKLNVENVKNIDWMFCSAIHKQATLDQLQEWRFSGDNKVGISCLFNATEKGLDFSILNGWRSSTKKGTVFFIASSFSNGHVFVDSNNKKDSTLPAWFGNIEELE